MKGWGGVCLPHPFFFSIMAADFDSVALLNKYIILAVAVVAVVALFLVFSGNPLMDFDQRGIAHDVKRTSNGYTFQFDCSDGTFMKCFSKESVEDLGHYGISGSMSEDGSIFFVSSLVLLDASDRVGYKTAFCIPGSDVRCC